MKSFDSAVFSGVSVEATLDNVDTLQALDPVAKAWSSKKIMLERGNPLLQTFTSDAAAVNYSIHGMTGVDKLHAAGILGKGVKVGVVDSGTAYDHPAVSSL